MTFEFTMTLIGSAVLFVAGLVVVVGRRRIARNASAAGARGKGMHTPRAAGFVGAFMILLGFLGPLIVLLLNPRIATSWPS